MLKDKPARLTACALLLVLLPFTASGAIVNGGFETGDLANWSGIGDTLADDGFYGGSPSDGQYHALMTTLSDPGDFTPGLSFIDAVPAADLESFLGLSAGALSGRGAVEGSAIQQSFVANAGDILSFDWNFLTDDAGSGDSAFFLIDGMLTPLADANSLSLGPTSSGFFLDETGYSLFTYVLTTSGPNTLAFGVVDADVGFGASGLAIDKVALTVIPLPPALLLFFTGVLAVGLIGRKKNN